MNKVNRLLAHNMKEARHRLRYSQEHLTFECGLSVSFIGEIELGKKFPSPKNFEKIAKALHLKPYELLLEAKVEVEDKDIELMVCDDDELITLMARVKKIEEDEEKTIQETRDLKEALYRYIKRQEPKK